MIENKIHENRFKAETSATVSLHNTEHLTDKAKFMLSCIEKWGMVQGKDGGEDSTGRFKLDLMTEEETVNRAAKMTEIAWNKMRGNSEYIHILPTYHQMEEFALNEKGKQEKA